MPSRRQRAYLARPEPVRTTTLQARTLRETEADARRRQRQGITYRKGQPRLGWESLRNGIPETPAYTWRARTYPWAQRAIAAAEAVHGTPASEAR